MAESDVMESPSSARVRELIFAYERQSNSTKPLEEYTGRPRAKSIGNTLSYKMFREANLEFHSIIDIEKELVKIEAHLNYYEVYDKATHVAFQEQLFNVLTSIVNIDPENQESAVQLKRKLILDTQKLATDLNSRLPYDGSHSYKGARRTYSSYVRKEEAVVSTTSVKSSEHRAILSSQSSFSHTLNGGFKSDESLNSTKDSVDLSSRQGESSSVDLNYLEERPQSSTPPPLKKIADETQTSSIPSVSKLKQFFSFRRETKPEVKVTSASYSGLSRSQSLNVKTNKYTIIKRSKRDEAKKQKEVISESDEGHERNDDQEISSSQKLGTSEAINASESADKTSQLHSLESHEYIEPAKAVEEYVEEYNKATHNVSVSKLKGLFEINRNETNEGLGLLTKKQNEFSSDFDVPFTAMNLGAYRLKRTISGNYMNFTGLLRNVDIEKKGDLNKSKSLSDLKITSFSYGAKYLEDDNDLSKEIDDNEDYEQVSIDAKKESEEVNNNVINNDDTKNDVDKDQEHVVNVPIELRVGSIKAEEQSRQKVSTSLTRETVQRDSETIFLSKSVETLKQAFENLSAKSEQTSKETREEEKYVLHKTFIEPVESNSTVVIEPVLKVPIQFRTGVSTVNTSEAVIENSTSSTVNRENNDDIRHILHRIIEPISSTTDEEPKLKVPIQLRTGFAKVNQSQKVSEAVIETRTAATVDKKVTIHHPSEPVLNIPVQLKVKGDNIEEAAIETDTAKPVDEDIQSESVLKIPVQLKVGREDTEELSELTKKFIYQEKVAHETSEMVSSAKNVETMKQVYENVTSTPNSELSNEVIKYTPHKTIKPIFNSPKDNEGSVLKVPIQLRVGLSDVNSSNLSIEREATETNILNEQSSQKASETLSSTGIVETLIETYETIASTTAVNNEEIEHVLHRTIEPSIVTNAEVPVLNVPIQLRTFAPVNPEVAEIIDSSNSNGVNNEEIKDILHRTINPSSADAEDTEEPVLKVPIQLRTFAGLNYSHKENLERVQETTENTHIFGVTEAFLQNEKSHSYTVNESTHSTNNGDRGNEGIKHILHRTIEPSSTHAEDTKEPELKVPIQLRIAAANVSDEITENKGFTSNSEVNTEEHVVHTKIEPNSTNVEDTKESELKVRIQLRPFATVNYSHEGEETTSKSDTIDEATSLASPGTVETLTQTFENMNSTSSTVRANVEDIQHIIHRTIEPIPFQGEGMGEPVIKVPIQLRTGFATISGSHELIENSEAIQETTESTDVIGTTETFLINEKNYSHKVNENIGSSPNSEVNNEEIKHILHRSIEPSSTKVEDIDERVLKVPIQLRTFASVNYSHEGTGEEITLEGDKIIEATSKSLASPGTVETLTQTFESLNSTTSTVRTNIDDIQHISHRTIEPIPFKGTDSMEEPVIKVPIQLRTGFATMSGSHEIIEKAEGMQETTENQDISGVTEAFLYSEKHHSHKVNESSTPDLEANNEEIKHILHRTLEPSSTDVEDTEDPVLKVPIQLRSFAAVNYSQEGTEHLGNSASGDGTIIETKSERTVLKLPINLRSGFTDEYQSQNKVLETKTNSGDVTITTTDIDKHENVPIVDVSYFSNGEDETFMSKDGIMSRSRIEERTGGFMKLLNAPTEFSTLSSYLGHAQHASSTSNVSMSYSQNKSMQHSSSTHISQRIVSTASSSSSSSQQSSQSYLQSIEQPTSYALLKSLSPQNQNLDSSVTTTDVGGDLEMKRTLKINLNVSQENIIDEILRETDSLENVDEEFERVLEENTK